MNNSGKVIWLFTGAAVGAAIALLYAPKSGEDTRRAIGKQASKGIRDLSEKGREAIQQGRELYQQGVEMTDEAAEMWEREVIERSSQILEG